MQKITREILIEKAVKLLEEGTVNRVLGWKKGEFGYDLTPAVFTTAEELNKEINVTSILQKPTIRNIVENIEINEVNGNIYDEFGN